MDISKINKILYESITLDGYGVICVIMKYKFPATIQLVEITDKIECHDETTMIISNDSNLINNECNTRLWWNKLFSDTNEPQIINTISKFVDNQNMNTDILVNNIFRIWNMDISIFDDSTLHKSKDETKKILADILSMVEYKIGYDNIKEKLFLFGIMDSRKHYNDIKFIVNKYLPCICDIYDNSQDNIPEKLVDNGLLNLIFSRKISNLIINDSKIKYGLMEYDELDNLWFERLYVELIKTCFIDNELVIFSKYNGKFYHYIILFNELCQMDNYKKLQYKSILNSDNMLVFDSVKPVDELFF